MTRICFVCLGNICRSPTAEGVFKPLAEQAGVADRFHVESAGVGGWHVGEPADSRTRRAARAHGVELTGTAQQFRRSDFARFDLLIAMDGENAAALRQMAPSREDREKVRLLREFDPQAHGDLDVPDPYYGGADGFEEVYQMIERSCRALLEDLTAGRDRPSHAAGTRP